MKIVLYLSISLILLGCSTNDSKPKEEQNTDATVELKADKTFDQCFTAPDSTFKQTVLGCSNGYYKIINDQFVLRIAADLAVGYDECADININPSDSNSVAQLLIFEKGKANVTGICTKTKSVVAVQPIKTLDKCIGRISIGKSDPTDYQGQQMHRMTIMVHDLIFADPDTYEEIKVKDQLFWKVLFRGAPGE